MLESINLSYERSIHYAMDKDFERHSIGIHSLLYNYRNKPRTWDVLINTFRTRLVEDTDPFLISILSLVPQHPDIAWDKSNILIEDLRARLRKRISKFTRDDVIKLLSFVDEDGFERGTVGQCVAAIISIVENNKAILDDIAKDKTLRRELRKSAITLLSYQGMPECQK